MAAAAETAVNALKKLEANKTCVNCGAYNRFGHQNVCEKVRTFVCGTCKSAHQSFSMRVKSVSMSNWTMDEVDALRESNGGGNVAAARVWLGRWDEAQLRKPTKDDPLEYYKHFIDRVYNAKEFYEAKGERGTTAAASSRTGTTSGHQSAAVPDLLDLDPPADVEASTAATMDACSSLEKEEWGSFEAAVVPSSCLDEEFGALASASVPTLTSGSDEFADFSTAPGPASAVAHTEVFGAFASAASAPTSMSFDPFAGSNVVVPSNAPVSAGVTSLDPGVFAPTSQGQQSVATAAAPVSAPKDFSVFDGLAAPLPTAGTFQRDGRDQRRAGWEKHDCGQPQHQMRAGLGKQQRMDTLQPPGGHPQQQQQQQLMAGCGNAGMNPISMYFSPIVPGAFSGNSSRDLKSSSRDPFAGLGL
uniref:Arf-GAP domain-containing protein n=1 Tax=Hyaloperonospora arabidopsidis (strain Emoy2) TaxID=559515 RepID=M4BEZ7_HYAAE